MKKYDLHIHTGYSPCSMNKPETILKVAKKVELDGIAITDHNTIKGAKVTKKLNKDKDFEVILGEEIKTNCGDVLALCINEEIKKGDLFEVIDKVKAQDGILIVAHPYREAPWLKFRYPLEKLVGKVDGVEVFNSRNIFYGNTLAKKIVKDLDFAKIGASDAHIALDVGKGYTLFKDDLRKDIKKRKTVPGGSVNLGLISGVISAVNKRILTPLKVKKTWI
jgi:hypothetical protein